MTNILTNVADIAASGAAQQQGHAQPQILQAAVAFVAGSLVTFLVSNYRHRLSKQRDAGLRVRKAKDEFLTVLGRLESRIPQRSAHIDSWTEVFHRESIIPLRDAVFTVRTYLSDESAARVLDLWHRYEDEHADGGSFLSAQISHQIGHAPAPVYPDDLLRTYMQRFREEVGHAA